MFHSDFYVKFLCALYHHDGDKCCEYFCMSGVHSGTTTLLSVVCLLLLFVLAEFVSKANVAIRVRGFRCLHT